jgi:hypothetical protein
MATADTPACCTTPATTTCCCHREELQQQAGEMREVAFVKKHVWVYAIDHPTYGRLIVKEHPFKRDFNGSQVGSIAQTCKYMITSSLPAVSLQLQLTTRSVAALVHIHRRVRGTGGTES